MSYQVLARKWRPKSFREMVGQEHVLQALVNALDNDRLHHAYLFTGTRGVGKTTIARILAKCINCEKGVSSEPCGACSSCLEIAEGRSVDLIEVDAASRTKVDDTRELLDNVQYAPTRSRYKVYLIDEVHMLSAHSFNALLKTLEEPPPHVKFLLATTDPQKLPATVLSRCLQFNLKNMPAEQIVGHLANVLGQESVNFDESALWLLARAAGGSMRDALSLTDQAIAFGSGRIGEDDVRGMLGTVDMVFVYRLLAAVAAGKPAGLLAVVQHMSEHAPDFESALDELISLIHRVAMAQAVPDAIDNSWGDAEEITKLAVSLTAEDIQLFYQIALNGKRDIGLAPDARSGFEMIVLRMQAFRPVSVIDPYATIEPAAPVAAVEPGAPPASAAAGEVGDSGKKSDEPAPVGLDSSIAGPAAGTAQPVVADEPLSLQELLPQQWPQLLQNLGLVGIVHNIASHCELRQCEGNALHFVLDEGNAALFNQGHSEKVRLALQNYFNHSVKVSILPGVVHGETPAMRQQRLKAQRQQEAVSEIEGDPLLQQLIARFDGELDSSSIAPRD